MKRSVATGLLAVVVAACTDVMLLLTAPPFIAGGTAQFTCAPDLLTVKPDPDGHEFRYLRKPS